MRALVPSLNSVMINERDECEYVALGNILHTNKNILYFPPQCKNLAPLPLHAAISSVTFGVNLSLSLCHRSWFGNHHQRSPTPLSHTGEKMEAKTALTSARKEVDDPARFVSSALDLRPHGAWHC